MDNPTTPGYRVAYNINPNLKASNRLDGNGNPTGGAVELFEQTDNPQKQLIGILWQNGPRGFIGGTEVETPHLAEPNGAFVEDVLWAALQRLEFFQDSKFRCRENALAITKIEEALFILKDRQLSRSERGVEGKHEV